MKLIFADSHFGIFRADLYSLIILGVSVIKITRKKTKNFILIFIASLLSTDILALDTPLRKLSDISVETNLIKIQSYNASSFTEIQNGSYKNSPVGIDALIAYPKNIGDNFFPIVVVVHDSGGPDLFDNRWFSFNRESAKILLEKGIAVIFLDNFSARGVTDTISEQFKVPVWSTFIDAFMALKHLSENPRINIKKVGIHGSSRGGMVSTLAFERRLRDALVSDDLYFAAAQPRSPDCAHGGMFRNPYPTEKTQIWMVLGEIDDWTLARPCIEMGMRIKENGGNIKVTVKKGWGHGFTANFKPMYISDAQVFHKCPPWYTEDNGEPNPEAYSFQYSCIEKGATVGGGKASIFMPDFLKFWDKTLLDLSPEKIN